MTDLFISLTSYNEL